jgi:hypothetical protein
MIPEQASCSRQLALVGLPTVLVYLGNQFDARR